MDGGGANLSYASSGYCPCTPRSLITPGGGSIPILSFKDRVSVEELTKKDKEWREKRDQDWEAGKLRKEPEESQKQKQKQKKWMSFGKRQDKGQKSAKITATDSQITLTERAGK